MARQKTTGNFTTRDDLERCIWRMKDAGCSWAQLEHVTGCNPNTINTILKGRRPYGTGRAAA